MLAFQQGHVNVAPRLLLAHDLQYDLPCPGPVIEVYEDYLLPRAQGQPFVVKWDYQRGTEERSSYVGVPVAITPPAVMVIGYVPWSISFPHTLEVGY